jgi:ADP-heptose:LPS heptosyltransferase
MKHLLEATPAGARIAVIRLRSLGDCVLTTPALALLKSHRPDLKVGVVVEDRFRAVFEGNPDVDEILGSSIADVRGWRPRMIVNLHGGTRSMVLTAASSAAIRAGFGHHSGSFVYSAKIPRAQEVLGEERPVHTAEHLASAMFWLGVPMAPIPRAKLIARDHPAAATTRAAAGGCAVIHPFASSPQKTWAAERFLALAAHLRTSGLEPVFLAGAADDAAPFAPYRVLRGAPLDEVKNLIAGAQLFLGNDSGPAHIAAAFGVPVVVIFGASNPTAWAPWRTESRVLAAPVSITQITVDQVTAAAASLLQHRVSA